MVRKVGFSNEEDMRKELQTNCPYSVYSAAIYSSAVATKVTLKGIDPVKTDLVFDLDLNDYDELRTCCKDKKVCD